MMEQILLSGLLYLIVIAIVLTIKPKFMFTEDGVWKEFGIGRNPATHTWLPFWLFAILWALVSYIIVIILLCFFRTKKSSGIQEKPYFPVSSAKISQQQQQQQQQQQPIFELPSSDEVSYVKPKSSMKSRSRGKAMDLPDGYYILNSEATEAAGGIPKYIFLGKGLPE